MPEPNTCAATALCQHCGPLRLAEFLPYRLSLVAECVSQAFAARYAEEFGLGVSEWRVMAVLGESECLSTQAVIGRTEMDRVKVSRAVIRLDDRGLLLRELLPGDQRAHLLRLSPHGLSLYRRIVPRACALQAELAGALDPAELAALDAILTKLHRQAAQLPR
ncbi:MAG: MarR family transcriptional regulator [Azospirillum brasilense]|nr:MAG: MarR family transcriptional regulator [Azospirillum brasilense]